MLRELTSFFIAVFSLLYVYQLSVLASDNSAAYGNYLSLLKNPFMVLFNIVTLVFALYHSFTWFYLTGKVQPIRVRKWTTTPLMALAGSSVLFVTISYTVVMLFLAGR